MAGSLQNGQPDRMKKLARRRPDLPEAFDKMMGTIAEAICKNDAPEEFYIAATDEQPPSYGSRTCFQPVLTQSIFHSYPIPTRNSTTGTLFTS